MWSTTVFLAMASMAIQQSAAIPLTEAARNGTITHHVESFASKHSGLSKGALAGVVVGSVVGGLLIIGVLASLCCCGMFKKGNKKADRYESQGSYGSVDEKLAPPRGVERSYQPGTGTTHAAQQPASNAPATVAPTTGMTQHSAAPAMAATTGTTGAAMTSNHGHGEHGACGAHCDNCQRLNKYVGTQSSTAGSAPAYGTQQMPSQQYHVTNGQSGASNDMGYANNAVSHGQDAYAQGRDAAGLGSGYAQTGQSGYSGMMDKASSAIESGAKRQNMLQEPGVGRM